MDIVSYAHADEAHKKADILDDRTSNIDNTSDADKPISTAVQTALNQKVNTSDVLTPVPANAVFTDTTYTNVSEFINDANYLTSETEHPADSLTNDDITNINSLNGETFIASGDITNGDCVALNDNGTVSSITATVSPSVAGAISGVASGNSVSSSLIVYDRINNKNIVFVSDNSQKTLSYYVVNINADNSITTESSALVHSNSVYKLSFTFDANNVLYVAFYDSSDKDIYVYCFDTSGFGISIIDSASSSDTATGCQIAYHEQDDTVVILSTDSSSLKSRVVVLSGGVVSLQTAQTVYNLSSIVLGKVIYDVTSQNFVALMRPNSTQYSAYVIGVVDGVVSIGSGLAVSDAENYSIDMTINKHSGRIIIGYCSLLNAGIKIKELSVSGLSVSIKIQSTIDSGKTYNSIHMSDIENMPKVSVFAINTTVYPYYLHGVDVEISSDFVIGGLSVLSTSFVAIDRTQSAYNINDGKFIVGATGFTGSYYFMSYIPETLESTKTKLVGIANSSSLDGGDVKVLTIGSIANNQSGMSVGEYYYVDDYGNLTTTNSFVYIGKALSSTRLLINGGAK